MKQFIIASIIGLCTCATASAQNYRDSRYYNPGTDHLDYSQGRVVGGSNHTQYNPGRRYNGNGSTSDSYVGLRIGPSFSHVNSDDAALDGGSMKTGLNVGLALGTRIAYNAPLYIESGFYYTEKGGKGNYNGGKFTYNLDYLEIPLLFKYKYSVDGHFRVEPYFGGYFAVGVGGKIKDYCNRSAYSSFSDHDYGDSFQRCDAGLKFGLGASYDMFYMELGYDLGLTNICHDAFDTSRNGALQLNFGVNF